MNDKIKLPSDEDNQIDDLFRKTLGDHKVEPSDNPWKGVSRKLFWNEISRFNFTNLPKGYWMASIAVIAVISGLLFFYSGNKHALQPNSLKDKDVTAYVTSGNAPSANSTTGQASTRPGMVKQTVTDQITAKPGNLKQTVADQPATKPVVLKPTTSSAIIHERSVSGKTQGIAATSKPASAVPVNTGRDEIHPMEAEGNIINSSSSSVRGSLQMLKPLDFSDLYITDLMDTVISFQTPHGIMRVQKDKPVVPQSLSADFGITPEWVNYNTSHAYSEMNYWLNVNFAYHFSRFSIQTGVALGYVFDEGKYVTKYISNDSIGYFTSVISFSVDPENQNQLIFNTKNVAVYDSLQHFADDRTRNRYTYLEFPLLFGYKIFETNKLSLDIMGGPALSVLVATREAQPFIDYPNARIVRVDDNTSQRVKTNWKITLGLHLEYRVTKKLGCYLEPSYKYYFNSFIKSEQTSAKEPYSVGIGLGIRYYFGHIKK